jgi:hypothetical protein
MARPFLATDRLALVAYQVAPLAEQPPLAVPDAGMVQVRVSPVPELWTIWKVLLDFDVATTV